MPENNLLNIIVIHPRYCIRAQKQIEGLLDAGGVNITLLMDRKRYGRQLSEAVINGVTIHSLRFGTNFLRQRKLLRLLKILIPGADVIHCHNEPNFHVRQIIEAYKGTIPIVYDIHDLTSMRSGLEDADEAFAYTHSDAVIHVSEPFIKYGDKKYGATNTHVIMSLPSSRNILKPRSNWSTEPPFRFVYQGAVIDRIYEQDDLYAYRDYTEIFQSILDEGHSVDVFGNRDHDKLPAYKALEEKYPGFKLKQRLPYPGLLQRLNGYDFGIVGFNMNYDMPESSRQYLHGAIGNKLFDYLFAGIPVITINSDAMSEFVEKHRCGFVKTSGKRWSEIIDLNMVRRDLHILADEHSMERQITKLKNIYQDLLLR
ncbi:MAG: glycosyltransferase [Candidatus Marinimicrobia bacterium]|nr:glycosyltransferase [Candidatus Neomarinimicrobiota bacterium]